MATFLGTRFEPLPGFRIFPILCGLGGLLALGRILFFQRERSALQANRRKGSLPAPIDG